MKKTITLIMILMLVISALSIFTACDGQDQNDDADTESDAQANDGQEQTNKTDGEEEDTVFDYDLLSDDTYAIKKLRDNTITEVTIPKTYKGKAVTKIMSKAFEKADKLTYIAVQDNIQVFEKGAFFGCSSLEELVLPFVGAERDSFETLGYIFGTASFPGAQKVEQSFKISDGLAGSDNFYIPSSLKKVTVSEGEIHIYTFEFCSMIKELVFEDGVTEIESLALWGCDALESVSMGKSITEISDECFKALTSLKNVLIGENVTKIGYYAFDGCTALKSIVIPKKVSVIEKYAFDQCTGLESITFECTSGWYRDYGSASGTGMDVTDPSLNVKNLTDAREYSSDRWKRR